MRCFFCNTENVILERVTFSEECQHCRADLHICMTCGFYDAGAYNECREPTAERVTDKERANHCEYFLPALDTDAGNTAADAAKQALESLFKK